MSASPNDRRKGFTLIEVVVAVTIMAVALGALLPAFGTGLRGSRAVEDRSRLIAAAQSRLADVGAGIPLAPGRYEGETETGTWRVEVAGAVGDAGAGLRSGALRRPDLRLYAVHVRITGEGGARERLTTLRLGPAP